MGKYKEYYMDIQQGYEVAQRELDEFTAKVINELIDEGVIVDTQSYTKQCRRMYILGKLQMLSDKVLTKQVTKENGNEKKSTSKRRRK